MCGFADVRMCGCADDNAAQFNLFLGGGNLIIQIRKDTKYLFQTS
jgi:hypothetical protein